MSRDDPQMKIRLPAELKACIEEAAAANNRTMNSEIVVRLIDSFAPAPPPPPVPLDKLITEVNLRTIGGNPSIMSHYCINAQVGPGVAILDEIIPRKHEETSC